MEPEDSEGMQALEDIDSKKLKQVENGRRRRRRRKDSERSSLKYDSDTEASAAPTVKSTSSRKGTNNERKGDRNSDSKSRASQRSKSKIREPSYSPVSANRKRRSTPPPPSGPPPDSAAESTEVNSTIFCALLVREFLKVHGFDKAMSVFDSELRVMEKLDYAPEMWASATEQQKLFKKFIQQQTQREHNQKRSSTLEDVVQIVEAARQLPSDEVRDERYSSKKSQRYDSRRGRRSPSSIASEKDARGSPSRRSRDRKGLSAADLAGLPPRVGIRMPPSSVGVEGMSSNISVGSGRSSQGSMRRGGSARRRRIRSGLSATGGSDEQSPSKEPSKQSKPSKPAPPTPQMRAVLLERRSKYVRAMCDEAVQNMLATLDTPQGKEALKREQANQCEIRKKEKRNLANLDKDEREKIIMRKKFAKYDVDASGFIDRVEFKLLVRDMSIPMLPAELEATFQRFDTDRNNMIGFDEFVHWFETDAKVAIRQKKLSRVQMLAMRKYRNSTGQTDLHHARRALLMETATKTRNIALQAFHLKHPELGEDPTSEPL